MLPFIECLLAFMYGICFILLATYVVGTSIFLILQMRKLVFSEVKEMTQDHSASKWEGPGLNPHCLITLLTCNRILNTETAVPSGISTL